MPSATYNPRQRLSILTNASLGHDVSAALSQKTAADASAAYQRSIVYGETAAPPPSPIDFSFSHAGSGMKEERRGSESS